MKVINIRKSKLLKISTAIVFVFVVGSFTNSFSMQHYYNVGFTTGLVTATNLNVRSGPGTKYPVVAKVPKNQYIRVFAGVGDWYIVQVEGDYVGAVSKSYVKPIYTSNSGGASTNQTTGGSNTSTGANTATLSMTADEQEVFNLINQQRTSNGLAALKLDTEVLRVARIKAQDMVNNNYFAHESPTYGTPFQMLNSFKISYRTAGENIAGNSNNQSAVTSWMNSSGHRANILNSSYNYTGIGVVNGSKYGKIYVQMFIGK